MAHKPSTIYNVIKVENLPPGLKEDLILLAEEDGQDLSSFVRHSLRRLTKDRQEDLRKIKVHLN